MRDNLLMENRDLGNMGCHSEMHLVRPSLIMQSHNRFETLHIARKCHCRALSKISQQRLGNRVIHHVHFMRVESWVSNGNQSSNTWKYIARSVMVKFKNTLISKWPLFWKPQSIISFTNTDSAAYFWNNVDGSIWIFVIQYWLLECRIKFD